MAKSPISPPWTFVRNSSRVTDGRVPSERAIASSITRVAWAA
jgi:hypothetical protein